MKIDSKAIRELAELLDDTGLNEVEISEGDKTLRVSKGNGTVISASPMQALSMPSDPAEPQQANMNAPSSVASSHPGAVTSPMVGTLYLKPDPNSPDFVKKGDRVNAGDTLLIIEAMKVMNPIKAEKSGTITQILVDNGQPVEFGDVMMVIE
ncbi:MAG: acetyl-CoA carboxylase biotin carboxyl carrier protein [Alphaproteobacteria bacterium]|nr:acetyl-CoA carboxylase biotin carboxyl carrier protein [Alphaproteobacteria bacterium]